MKRLKAGTILFWCSLLLGVGLVAGVRADQPAGGAHSEVVPAGKDRLSPEERMQRRFPQPVLVSDLIGLPLQDYDDRILGHVTEVTRSQDGKIGLVVSHCDWFVWDCRLVRVPIDTVVILGRHLNLMDIKRSEFLDLPAWAGSGKMQIAAGQSILIGLGRR